MRNPRTSKRALLCVLMTSMAIGSLVGCNLFGGGLAALPFAQIAAVQLFDQPNYTVAFSIESAVADPSLVAKINWVFGDGSGFVEGPAGITSITHQYGATGTYAVSAFVFDANDFVVEITGTANVAASGTPTPTPTEEPPGQTSGPNPSDEAEDVRVDSDLTWTSAEDATSYDVYLGVSETAVTDAS